jgi:ribosomal protein L7/L12
MADIKAIAEELVNLTVKEVNELAQVLKDEYGLSQLLQLLLLLQVQLQVVKLLLQRRRTLSTLFSLR